MKPVILGMVKNDIDKDVLDPMYGSGRRLVAIVGRDVFDEYERMNLLEGDRWKKFGARRNAYRAIKNLRGRKIMVLGNEVWWALMLPQCHMFHGVECHGSTWYRVPHPSGLNIMYNDENNRRMARDLFRTVAERRM